MWSRLKSNYLIAVAFALVCLFTIPIMAQDTGQFGVRAGFYTDAEDAFIGAEYLAPIADQVFLNPNVEYVFMDNGTFMTFNLDAHYDFPTRSNVYVWAGGGLGVMYINPDGPVDSNTDAGLNLLFGLGFKTSGSVVPYVQGKAILADNSDFALGFGLRF